jgi:1-deoxy-D-xylulose-5-phosphate reductoisomerase
MRHAIGYALQYPRRASLPIERLDFAKLSRLDFEAPDEERFPALRLARLAMTRGGVQGAVLNAAKEVALEAFIAGETPFLSMAEITEHVMDELAALPEANGMDDVFEADLEARRRARRLLATIP